MSDDKTEPDTEVTEPSGGLPEGYDPTDYKAAEVKEELAEAPAAEKDRVGAAELAGKERATVLAAAGVEPGERLDATGRRLFPWEVAPTVPEERA